MSVTSFVNIPKNGDFQILSDRPIFIWFPIVSNKSSNTVLEHFLNCFTSSAPRDLSSSNTEFSLLCAISCLQSQYKAVKPCLLLVHNRFSSSLFLFKMIFRNFYSISIIWFGNLNFGCISWMHCVC